MSIYLSIYISVCLAIYHLDPGYLWKSSSTIYLSTIVSIVSMLVSVLDLRLSCVCVCKCAALLLVNFILIFQDHLRSRWIEN